MYKRQLLQAEDLLAVDKPPGIPTVGRESLETWVKANFPGFRPCHRLDAMTGGVVLFAKGAAYQHATALFLERRVEKDVYKRQLLIPRGPQPPNLVHG